MYRLDRFLGAIHPLAFSLTPPSASPTLPKALKGVERTKGLRKGTKPWSRTLARQVEDYKMLTKIV